MTQKQVLNKEICHFLYFPVISHIYHQNIETSTDTSNTMGNIDRDSNILPSTSTSRPIFGIDANLNYIQATDGYSSQKQELKIEVDLVPFTILVYYLAIGVSSLFSVIGFVQYRGQIYGILCKKKYRLGNIFIEEDEEFIIQIILSAEECRKAKNYLLSIDKHLGERNQKMEELFDVEQRKEYQFDRDKIKRILQQYHPDIDIYGYDKEFSYPYCIIKSYLYNKILKKKSKSNKLFRKLKAYALKKSQSNVHRWYEYYVEVRPTKVTNSYDGTPKVFFKQKTLYNALNVLLDNKEARQSISELNFLEDDEIPHNELPPEDCFELEDLEFRNKCKEFNEQFKQYRLFLILENLRCEAWGFKPPSLLNFTHGQCVQKRTQDIQVARAMQKRKSIFNPIFSLINMDYLDIPLSQNTPLPNWMDYNCHHHVIEIFGKLPVSNTQNQDKKDLVIRIEDIYNFICREFHIVQVSNSKKYNLKGYENDWQAYNEENSKTVDLSYSQCSKNNPMAVYNKFMGDSISNDISRSVFQNTEQMSQPVSPQHQTQEISNQIGSYSTQTVDKKFSNFSHQTSITQSQFARQNADNSKKNAQGVIPEEQESRKSSVDPYTDTSQYPTNHHVSMKDINSYDQESQSQYTNYKQKENGTSNGNGNNNENQREKVKVNSSKFFQESNKDLSAYQRKNIQFQEEFEPDTYNEQNTPNDQSQDYTQRVFFDLQQ